MSHSLTLSTRVLLGDILWAILTGAITGTALGWWAVLKGWA